MDDKKTFIQKKVELFAKKGGLKTLPKIEIKPLRDKLAHVPFYGKRIIINENFLSLWERGIFSDEDVEFVLAHEIGHLIDDGNSIKDKLGSCDFKCIVLKILYIGLIAISAYAIYILPVFIIPFFILVLFFPYYFRTFSIRPELVADKNAVTYNLIDAKTLLFSRFKINEYYRKRRPKGRLYIWCKILNFLRQPSLTERAQNLGVDVRFELKISPET